TSPSNGAPSSGYSAWIGTNLLTTTRLPTNSEPTIPTTLLLALTVVTPSADSCYLLDLSTSPRNELVTDATARFNAPSSAARRNSTIKVTLGIIFRRP